MWDIETMCDPYIIRPGNVFPKGVNIIIIVPLEITKYNLARTKERGGFQDCPEKIRLVLMR